MPSYFFVGRVTSSAGALGKPHDTSRHEGGLRYRLEIVGTAVLREGLVVPCTRPDIKHCMGMANRLFVLTPQISLPAIPPHCSAAVISQLSTFSNPETLPPTISTRANDQDSCIIDPTKHALWWLGGERA
jgi:hypothetical protein